MLISANRVSKSYGHARVVDAVDLHLADGESVALVGPNGCGKTTFMTMLVGLTEPDAGTVVRRTDRIGWVPQRVAVYRRLTCAENLAVLGRIVTGEPVGAAEVELALAEAGLVDHASRQAWELSGGQQQRLHLAIGLLGNPRAIVLDEPTTGLDLAHVETLWSLLEQRRETGTALLFATHSVREASRADRIVVLCAGHVAYEGPLEGLAALVRDDAFTEVADPIERGMLTLWHDSTPGIGAGA